ncbi:protein RRP5 homolog [Diabrotica virgifera virgifera]|uniref:rRNA biogenesis protein RRP5 n=1 Tax=Diabrotica virgifera virgifera TaxID=50390 RepID=A0A6P7FXL7_DIAVI|nr:protein RRP5 homolog [Diabrotica virgifera virgifera]
MMDDEDFPRGGVRPKKALKRKDDDNLFSSAIKPKPKKAKKAKKTTQIESEDSFHSSLQISETLSYRTLQQDMIILACIKQIKDVSMDIELPGLTFGQIKIINISDSFTHYLQENNNEESITLVPQMFSVGQMIIVKVLSIENRDEGTHIQCTLNPKDINSGKYHNSFPEGLLVWASVTSELEHGYKMDIGVNNCRAFLPFKNVDKNRKLIIGQPLWCVVTKCDSSEAAATIQLSCRTDRLKKCKISEIDSLHNLIPGMQVDVMVETVRHTGLYGKFLNDFFAYIDEGQLEKSLSKYKEGNLLTAYVLYTNHVTKITYLTMFDMDKVPAPKYTEGDILVGEVISTARKGIYLSLPSKEKCFVTHKRLLLSFPKKYDDSDLTDMLKLKFVVGSRHSCRILAYSNVTRSYIGTLEQKMIREQYFTSADLKPGQLVEGVIVESNEKGLVVKVGRVRCFASNFYLSSVAYTENIKKKFKEGRTVKARVWDIKGNNVLLTLKSEQVLSDRCLTTVEDAKRGERYPCVIVKTYPNGAYVIFYSNISGWLPKKYLDEENENDKPDPQQLFFIGQVINPWILGVKEQRVILSLRPPKNFGFLKIGEKVNGVIGRITKDNLFIKTQIGKPVGVVPVNHLSETLSLCPTLINTFKVGDEINNLLCIDNTDNTNILSKRESLAITRTPKFRIKKLDKFKLRHLVRCTYLSQCDEGIYVRPCQISDYHERVLIKYKDILGKGVKIGVSLLPFEPNQVIVAKIKQIQENPKSISLTAKLADVFDNKVESVIGFFTQHLQDIQTIRTMGKEKKWDLYEYEPGETVLCRVTKLGDGGGCLVSLPNGLNALVPTALCTDVKIGDKLPGVFLTQNFDQKYGIVCLKPEISERINKNQDGIITCKNLSWCRSELLFIGKTFAIALLKQIGGNGQLVYLPTFLHENDFKGSCKSYYEEGSLRITLCGQLENYLIGMSRRQFLNLNKHSKPEQKYCVKTIPIREPSKEQNTIDDGKVHDVSDSDVEVVDQESSMEEDSGAYSENESDDSLEEADDDDSLEEADDDDEGDVQEEESDDELNQETDSFEDELELEDDSEDEDSSNNEDTESKGESINMTQHSDELDRSVEEVEINEEEDSSEKTNNTRTTNVKVQKKTIKKFSSSDSITGPLPVLSGMNSFFNEDVTEEPDVSSDDEVEETTVKKKKLSASERAQQAKEEEERIRQIEKELADPTKAPESAEHFDRLLLASPNSSKLWLQYMAFHVAATEFEKARAVAKRALENINYTYVDERFNIWITLLNFENTYGTNESFSKVFEEAVKCNDDLKIYLETIRILAESGQIAEMEEKIKKVRNKHKQNSHMWIEVAKIYYMLDKFKEARNLKDAALKSITIKKMQLDIIVQFALMEFNYGEPHYGSHIFEAILSSDPKKVTIWTMYVDQLVKKGKIDEARQVLDRSVSQHLPVKSLKSLFLKYKMFEETYGNPETVQEVKEKVKELMSKISTK